MIDDATTSLVLADREPVAGSKGIGVSGSGCKVRPPGAADGGAACRVLPGERQVYDILKTRGGRVVPVAARTVGRLSRGGLNDPAADVRPGGQELKIDPVIQSGNGDPARDLRELKPCGVWRP